MAIGGTGQTQVNPVMERRDNGRHGTIGLVDKIASPICFFSSETLDFLLSPPYILYAPRSVGKAVVIATNQEREAQDEGN